MKRSLLKKLFFCTALIPSFGMVGRVTAQTFTVLHSFTGGSDGGEPFAGVILSGNTLYGTAEFGGGLGTVFALNTNGTGFTNLHSFGRSDVFPYTNSDGANPYAGLILSGNTLYGTASGGGSSGNGTVFAVNTDGTGFTNLYSFTATSGPFPATNSDGADPYAGLLLSGNTLYGMARFGGSSARGTVFAVNTDGSGFTNLHTFTAVSTNSSGISTNGDGTYPSGGLILSGNTLYGTTLGGGPAGDGTVFAINTDGTGFTNLYSFTARNTNSACCGGANSDGSDPYGGLILSGNTLYGTAYLGGNSGYGTVFSLSFAPQLAIALSGPNVVLSWPTNVAGFDYSGYGLQSTTNLVSPVWNTNSPAPVVVNGQNTVCNPISGTRQFYRLSQ